MPDLFSYCIPIDDGAAPNPYWGVCTLVICKPAIRRVAKVGDWVVGTGSKNSPIGDITTNVVYAMRVTEKMTMQEYDSFTRDQLPDKIPEWDSSDVRRRLGDSIYSFGAIGVPIRRSVHNESNRLRDLGGKSALISSHFFYFGDHPVELPENLRPLIKHGQGHRHFREDQDGELIAAFILWIEGLGFEPNVPYGEPQCMDLEKFQRCVVDAEEE